MPLTPNPVAPNEFAVSPISTVTVWPWLAPTKKSAEKLPFKILKPANSVSDAIRDISVFKAVISDESADLSSALLIPFCA